MGVAVLIPQCATEEVPNKYRGTYTPRLRGRNVTTTQGRVRSRRMRVRMTLMRVCVRACVRASAEETHVLMHSPYGITSRAIKLGHRYDALS